MGVLSRIGEARLSGETLTERVAGAVAGLDVDVRIVADALDFASGVAGHHVQGASLVDKPDGCGDSGARLAVADEVDEFVLAE